MKNTPKCTYMSVLHLLVCLSVVLWTLSMAKGPLNSCASSSVLGPAVSQILIFRQFILQLSFSLVNSCRIIILVIVICRRKLQGCSYSACTKTRSGHGYIACHPCRRFGPPCPINIFQAESMLLSNHLQDRQFDTKQLKYQHFSHHINDFIILFLSRLGVSLDFEVHFPRI